MFPCKLFLEGIRGRYKHQKKFMKLFFAKKKRFFYLKWARRHGKTSMCLNLLIDSCLNNPGKRYAFIFTTYKSAKDIVLHDPTMMSMLPSQKKHGDIWTLNKSDLTVTFRNESVLTFYGADQPESHRGINCEGCVIDEWSQHATDDIWTNVIYPILDHNEGYAVFIYTPKGVGFASETYQRILDDDMVYEDDDGNVIKDDRWYCDTLSADESGLLSKRQLLLAEKTIGRLLYRQEYLCEDLADDDLVVIKQSSIKRLDKVNRAQKYMKRVVSVDPALEGGDECILYMMVNSEIIDEVSISVPDSTYITGNVLQFAAKHKCDNVVVDNIGLGDGVFGGLRRAGLNVIKFDSRVKATDSARFRDLKAEAWFYTREQISLGRIPPIGIKHEFLKKQLSAVKYEYSSSKSRIKIEDKAKTKKRLKCSPDRADAFVMGCWAYQQLPDDNRIKQRAALERRNRIGGTYDKMAY
jgi:hypothetical protein